jgi:peptidoglycan/xylan/chitin deacetylase (PgdA/CDA1 family)
MCLSRRVLLAAPAILSLAATRPATASDAPVEPRMRLANPAPDRLAVALTLDACPGGFDERIATGLVESGIAATIFVTNSWLKRNRAALAFLLAHPDLFGIENHGDQHLAPILGHGSVFGVAAAGDLAAVQREVTDGAGAIAAATGTAPRWYRGAAGYYTPSAMPAIQQLGFGIAAYSLNSDMGASLPADGVANRIAGAANGDVIVAHFNQPDRSSGLGVIAGARKLQSRGASFLRLDRLAATEVTYV